MSCTSRSVASLANARSSVATPLIGESAALATAIMRPGTRGAGRGWNRRVSTPSGMTRTLPGAAPKSRQMSAADDCDAVRIVPQRRATLACIRTKRVPAPLGELAQPPGGLQLDPPVHADRVMDAGHQRHPGPGQREQAVGEHLVVMDQVEVREPGQQRPAEPEAERERLGERPGLHPEEFEDVDPVAVFRQLRRAERVRLPVQVQAGQRAQHRARLQLGIGLAGEDLHVVPERGQFAGQVPQVDALATDVRLAAVGHEGYPERALVGLHAASHLLSVRCRVMPRPPAGP